MVSRLPVRGRCCICAADPFAALLLPAGCLHAADLPLESSSVDGSVEQVLLSSVSDVTTGVNGPAAACSCPLLPSCCPPIANSRLRRCSSCRSVDQVLLLKISDVTTDVTLPSLACFYILVAARRSHVCLPVSRI